MNTVNLIGNLTRDPEVRYSQSGMAIASFSVAINRGRDKEGKDKGVDFPKIIVFGAQAENCERFLKTGSKVGISGRIQTGNYDKDGVKVYTTDVIASHVEFLGSPKGKAEKPAETFEALDEDVPF